MAVSSSVSATFSEAVQASIGFTLTTSSGTAVAATVAYNSSTDTATLTPSAALAYGTTYTATVSGAKNSAGVAIELAGHLVLHDRQQQFLCLDSQCR